MSTAGTLGGAMARPIAFISAPSVQPGRVIPFPRKRSRFSVVEPAEDPIIRRVWALKFAGQMTEAAAGELHDQLIRLRELPRNPRENEAPR
jgi:hypothetical protein